MTLQLSELIADGASPMTDADVLRYQSAGYWRGRSIRSVLSDVADHYPDREALVGYRSDGDVVRQTYREFDSSATHYASVLASIGVSPGDAVAVMLPNWIEYASFIYGVNELGGIYVGIPIAYGERQVEAILSRSKAKVLVIPRRWRSGEHLSLARLLRDRLPNLEHVIVVDIDGADLVEGEHLWSDLLRASPRTFDPVASTAVCYLGFTSGTTGEPKGAMHTHESLLYSADTLADHLGGHTFGDPLVQLVASPTGHHTGFIWGVVFTVNMAGTGVHVDMWDPAWGVELIRREKVTTFFGAPTFLQDMMRTDLAGDPECPLRCVVVAGSSVPRTLPAQASRALGAYIAPAWGMTECSIIVSCTPAADDTVLGTDGSVFSGSEVKVIDEHGNDLPPGHVGELVVRGPALFAGYFDRPDATEKAFLDGGWFQTGDTASIDENGWVSLRGRLKDIIIRGGENIPVTEIETLLFDHPAVLNAAVVGLPDERLGERACAVLVLKEGVSLDMQTLSAYLIDEGLSKHYLPERLAIVDQLPTTQSGKIQKFRLRETLTETEPAATR
ncbi:AMP-binding protein [Rhodococcus opacus]|uniref:AMP-binding protein n=1 Tax=Rhodococcus opacus TaxID=37919 RepID=UPI001C45111C|nr:AMP-binding protein [Rhodococcus opacus]MBV6756673.1 AMP-binding protein [Rhodococcus opacus]